MILLWRKLHSALKSLMEPLNQTKTWSEERGMYRIHSMCSIHTATGRITMYDPNLQTMRKDFSLDLEGTNDLIVISQKVFVFCKTVWPTGVTGVVFPTPGSPICMYSCIKYCPLPSILSDNQL